MSVRRTVLFVLIIILGSSLYGQNILLKGKVLDAEYMTPVPYAAVYIHNTLYGTIADNVGEFTIDAPDSLRNGTLVVAREKYKIQFVALEGQHAAGIPVLLESDNYAQISSAFQDSVAARSGGLSYALYKAANFVKDDWIPLGDPETNKFDFGRIQTLPTYNPIEGLRLRAGVASNSRLHPNFFVNGYVAYGFRDQKWKYRGEMSYSVDRKAYHENEFPKNKVSLVYENDLYSPGEMHPRSPNNLLLITYRRSENQATYRNFAELNYEREYKNGLAHTFWVRRSRMVPQGELKFEHEVWTAQDPLLPSPIDFNDSELYTSEAGIQLRYSVREAYEQQKRKRKPLELTSPVFFLSHSMGGYELYNENYSYQRTELSIQKRFLLGNAGRLDGVAEAMKVWDTVPFPLLVYPNQRMRHHIENNAFFLNRAMEFMADEQYTMRFTFVGDNFILARVPFLNRLQLRELMTIRGSWGRLSSKNDPANSRVYNFPPASFEYGYVPYIEGTVGLTNILGLLRVEYVHRFTHRDHPDALLGRIRVDVTL